MQIVELYNKIIMHRREGDEKFHKNLLFNLSIHLCENSK